MEILQTILGSAPLGFVAGSIIAWLIKTYLAGTAWKRLAILFVSILKQMLDETDIDTYEFIQSLIDRLHSTSDKTLELENILQDEKIE